MRKIGEYVVYGGNGVMVVVDIKEESFGGVTRSYYVLRDVSSNSESLTYVPTDSAVLVSQMRPLLTKDEVLNVIKNAKDASDCEWAKDNRARTEIFKRILESGDRVKLISMIRTIYNAGLKREAEGKKNFVSDENAKQRAEKLIFSEFSIVLEMPETEVSEFIKKEMNK